MGQQNIESVHLLNTSSKSSGSPATSTKSSSKKSSPGVKSNSSYKQILLTDKFLVGNRRPNGKASALEADKPGSPVMQKTYHKRFKPYQQPKSDQNNSQESTRRVKLPNTYWTLKLERLPLRGPSTTSSPAKTVSAPSPIRLQTGRNLTPACVSSSEKFQERSVEDSKPLKNSADERIDFSNGSPAVPSISEDSLSETSASSMNSQRVNRADCLATSLLSASTDKSPGKKDDTCIGRSPSRASSLQLTKNSRTPQFAPMHTKDNREVVLICSSSDNSDDSSFSSNMSSSKPRGMKAKKKMRIHRKSGGSRDVIVIDDLPRSRKRRRSSSSSDEFEDSQFLHKRRRCEDVIDLTAIEESPPKVLGNRTCSSSDPNRTPEFVCSSAEAKNKVFPRWKMPVKKSLFAPLESSDSDQTPVLKKSFRLAVQNNIHEIQRGGKVDHAKGTGSGSPRSSDDSDTGSSDNGTGIDGSGALEAKTSEDMAMEQGEKLYEAMSESSFHSGASVNTESEDQTTVKGNTELVQDFTLDLNSEEDDDDVFVEDTTIMPSAFEPVSSPSASPEPEENLTEKVNYIRVLSLVSECSTDIEGFVGDNAESAEVSPLAEVSGESNNVHVTMDSGVSDEFGECGAVPKNDTPVIDSNDNFAAQPGPHIDSESEKMRHQDNVSIANVESTGHVQSVTSAMQTVMTQLNEHRGFSTSEKDVKDVQPWLSESFSQLEIRSLLAARGIATIWTVEKQMHFITLTQENLIMSKLEDDTRLPSQRLCFVAQYLRIFTNRLRIPKAEILSRLWQLIWEPLVSGSGHLTDEAVSMCMRYLRQLLVVHPPGQHQLVDEQYSHFLQQISNHTSATFGLWEHLETLAKSPTTVMMATFLVDLLLADLWAAVSSKKLSTALFLDLFWKGEARNHTRPVRRLMDVIDQAAAVLEKTRRQTVQINNLMALLNVAATECNDLTTELTLRWKKMNSLSQSFLIGQVYSASLRTQLISSLPEVQKVHAAYRQLFSSKSGLFSGRVKPVQLVGANPGSEETSIPEEQQKADIPPTTTPLMCSKSVIVTKSARLASTLTPTLTTSSLTPTLALSSSTPTLASSSSTPTLASSSLTHTLTSSSLTHTLASSSSTLMHSLIKDGESCTPQRNTPPPFSNSCKNQRPRISSVDEICNSIIATASKFNEEIGLTGIKRISQTQNLKGNPNGKCQTSMPNNIFPLTAPVISQLKHGCQPNKFPTEVHQKKTMNQPVNKCNNNNVSLKVPASKKRSESLGTSNAKKVNSDGMTSQQQNPKIHHNNSEKLKGATRNIAENNHAEQFVFSESLSITSQKYRGVPQQSKADISSVPESASSSSIKISACPLVPNILEQKKHSSVALSAQKLWEQQHLISQPKVRSRFESLDTNKQNDHQHAVPTDPKGSSQGKLSAQKSGVARRNSQPAALGTGKGMISVSSEGKGHSRIISSSSNKVQAPPMQRPKYWELSKSTLVTNNSVTSPLKSRDSLSAVSPASTSPLASCGSLSAVSHTNIRVLKRHRSADLQASISPLESRGSLSAVPQASTSPIVSRGSLSAVPQAKTSPIVSRGSLSALPQASTSPTVSRGSLSAVPQASTSPIVSRGSLSALPQARTSPIVSRGSLSAISQASTSPVESCGSLSAVPQGNTSPIVSRGSLSAVPRGNTNPLKRHPSLSAISQANRDNHPHHPLSEVSSCNANGNGSLLKQKGKVSKTYPFKSPFKAHNTVLQDNVQNSRSHHNTTQESTGSPIPNRGASTITASRADLISQKAKKKSLRSKYQVGFSKPNSSPTQPLQYPRKQKKRTPPHLSTTIKKSFEKQSAISRRLSEQIRHSCPTSDQQVRRKSEPLLKHTTSSKTKVLPNHPPAMIPQKPQTSHSCGSHLNDRAPPKKKKSSAEVRTGPFSSSSDSRVPSLHQATLGKQCGVLKLKPGSVRGSPGAKCTESTTVNNPKVLANSSTILHHHSSNIKSRTKKLPF